MRSSFGREFRVLYDVFTIVILNRGIHFNEAEMSSFVEEQVQTFVRAGSTAGQGGGRAVGAASCRRAGARRCGRVREWLGLAAVLLDDRGEVLHANCGAIELMGDLLYSRREGCGRPTPRPIARLEDSK